MYKSRIERILILEKGDFEAIGLKDKSAGLGCKSAG
jgi:hypothetical protein